MKKTTIACSLLLLFVFAASGLSAALNHQLRGSTSLVDLTNDILAECPNVGSLHFMPSGTSTGEQAMLGLEQQVAPMSGLLHDRTVCQSATPRGAVSEVVALDAITVSGDASNTQCSSSGMAFGGCFNVADSNNVAGVQCPGCESGLNQYCLKDQSGQARTAWRDALRLIFAGMDHTAGHDITKQDCNSDVRRELVDFWNNLFAGPCTSGQCTRLEHAFHSIEDADLTDTLLGLLDLPPITAKPFCNGADDEDRDPVRRSCNAGDMVCRADHTLGLVLPVKVSPGAAAVVYPTDACATGSFSLREALQTNLPGGAVRFDCPERSDFSIAGLCLAPLSAAGSAACLSSALNPNVFFTNLNDDARLFNLWVRDASGALLRDSGRAVTGAFNRLRSTNCTELTSSRQAACTSANEACSIGLLRRKGTFPGAASLAVNGALPTIENIRKLVGPVDPTTYPLAIRLFYNSLVGFGNISDPEEDALTRCYLQPAALTAASDDSGLITPAASGIPMCIGFNDLRCNQLICQTNTDCQGLGTCSAGFCSFPCNVNGDCPGGRSCSAGKCLFTSDSDNCFGAVRFEATFDDCPVITAFAALPSQVRVGGTINLTATAADANGDALSYGWTASQGTLSNPLASTTTYTCTEVGDPVITLTVSDGLCDKTQPLEGSPGFPAVRCLP